MLTPVFMPAVADCRCSVMVLAVVLARSLPAKSSMTPVASFLVLASVYLLFNRLALVIDDPRVGVTVLFAASTVAPLTLMVVEPFFTVKRDAVALGKAIGSEKGSESVITPINGVVLLNAKLMLLGISLCQAWIAPAA